ncbi:MAG: hypothetical protein AAGC55_27825, partial [Myxococcota bacterium]
KCKKAHATSSVATASLCVAPWIASIAKSQECCRSDPFTSPMVSSQRGETMKKQALTQSAPATQRESEAAEYQNDDDSSTENLARQVGELVQQFDEVIRLLNPVASVTEQRPNEPMVLVIPSEEDEDGEDGPGAALILPAANYFATASGEIDQEKLGEFFKKIGKSLRKINFGKVAKVVGKVVKGGLSGAAGGLPGIIAGATTAGLGALTKGGQSRPSAPPVPVPVGGQIAVAPTGPIAPPSGMTAPTRVATLAQGGSPLITQYITTNCGTHTTTTKRRSGEDLDEEVTSTASDGMGTSESQCVTCDGEAIHDEALHDDVHEPVPLGHEGEGTSDASPTSDIIEFLQGVQHARDTLVEALPAVYGFQWETE